MAVKPNKFSVLSTKKCIACGSLLKKNPVDRSLTHEKCYKCYTYKRLERGGYIIPQEIMKHAHS